jgi:hypothetical protein
MDKVKEILTDLVKEQLIDQDKFDVKNITEMLGNFPGSNMEQAIALSTKTSYDNTIKLLGRQQKKTDGDDASVNAANTAYNTETSEAVSAFLQLMRNDNFGIKNQTSEQVGQFGNNKANVGHLNAFEAVIALTFGGVNETEVTIGGGTEGHVATGNECRAVTKTWEAIDTTSVLLSTANGSGLPEVSHEARAVWLMANWVKYGYAPKLFGASVDTIKVVQADPADTNSCLRYCNASFTGETDTITKLYNLWANTDAGRRHFLSSIGTILSTDIVVRGQTLGKMLGGEKSFTKDMLEKVLQAGDNFEMADLTGHYVQQDK